MNQVILLAHVFFGLACILTTVWIFAEVINARSANVARIRKMCLASAIVMWICFLLGGYWYVTAYRADKAVILKGPWPFAHSLFMETKEHLVIMLLLLVTYLPIAASGDLAEDQGARRVVLWVAGLAGLLALLMDGEGGMIAMGVKLGLGGP